MLTTKKQSKTLTPEEAIALELIKKSHADIWSHPKGPRGGSDKFDNVCEYCGKKTGPNSMIFQILTSGIIVPNTIDEQTIWSLYFKKAISDQPQGGFSIGPECAKKLLGKEVDFYLGIERTTPQF